MKGTRSRSLLSRSRVNRAVEAARRVGGGLIVAAAHNVSGLRAGGGKSSDGSYGGKGLQTSLHPIWERVKLRHLGAIKSHFQHMALWSG